MCDKCEQRKIEPGDIATIDQNRAIMRDTVLTAVNQLVMLRHEYREEHGRDVPAHIFPRPLSEWIEHEHGEGDNLKALFTQALEMLADHHQMATVDGDPTRFAYLIWSYKHGMWWGPDERGYVNDREQAGRYQYVEALRIVSKTAFHMDPSKASAMIVAGPAEAPEPADPTGI